MDTDTDPGTIGPSTEANQLTEQMWREVIAQLRAFVRRRIANPDRADDLVGEILLRIHRTCTRSTTGSAWRTGCLGSRAMPSSTSTAGPRATASSSSDAETPPSSPPSRTPIEDPVGGAARSCALSAPAAGGLPPEQRRAVEMIDLDGMAQADAARSEGVSVSGMKSRVQRGRRRLAELLGQCCALTLDARGVPMDYTPPRRGSDCGDCGCG